MITGQTTVYNNTWGAWWSPSKLCLDTHWPYTV